MECVAANNSAEGVGAYYLYVFLIQSLHMPKLASNKRARYDYEILDTIEAGVVLTGQEVKSAKTGHAALKGAFVQIRHGEAWLKNAFIAPYTHAGNLETYDPYQNRKLLMRKKEIEKLKKKLDTEHLTIVPISLYTKAGKIKLEIGLGRGKKQRDKRAATKKRELDREARTRQYRAF